MVVYPGFVTDDLFGFPRTSDKSSAFGAVCCDLDLWVAVECGNKEHALANAAECPVTGPLRGGADGLSQAEERKMVQGRRIYRKGRPFVCIDFVLRF